MRAIFFLEKRNKTKTFSNWADQEKKRRFT